MDQASLFDDASAPRAQEVPKITSTAEVRELAREYFNLPIAEPPLVKAKREQAARAACADRRGLVAKWAPYEIARGYVSIHDPTEGEWHDLPWKASPSWTRWEARKRAEMYRAGDRHAYDLTSTQMHEIWQAEHPADEEEEGIVEDHPVEEDTDGNL